MKNYHKIAMLYLLGGAGTAAWVYSKGYAFDAVLLVTWPLKVTQVSSAPSLPAGSSRAKLVYS